MRRPITRSCLIALTALATAGALSPGAAQAAGARTAAVTKWTKISTDTGLGIASAGLYRTADGMLHVAWARHDTNSYSLNYSTVGPNAKLAATGTILKGWNNVSFYPRLVAGPSGGIRLVFPGANGVSGSPYNLGTVYSATATSAGTTWKLVKGSMSHTTLVPLTNTSATTQSSAAAVSPSTWGPTRTHRPPRRTGAWRLPRGPGRWSAPRSPGKPTAACGWPGSPNPSPATRATG